MPPTTSFLMIQAAHPIFYLTVSALKLRQMCEPIDVFRHLLHQIQRFESKLRPYYALPTAKIASYLLCLCLDASVIDKLHAPQINVSRLLQAVHNDSQGEKRLFPILKTLLENENISKELLMIGYLCITLGDIQCYLENDLNKVQAFTNALYQKIQFQSLHSNIVVKKYSHTFKIATHSYKLALFNTVGLLGLLTYYSFLTLTLNHYSDIILRGYSIQLGNILYSFCA